MGAQAPAPRLLRLKAEDQAKVRPTALDSLCGCMRLRSSIAHMMWCFPTLQVGRAALQKGKFTWITEAGRQERWIVASCGAYTVLWNFRWVGLAED